MKESENVETKYSNKIKLFYSYYWYDTNLLKNDVEYLSWVNVINLSLIPRWDFMFEQLNKENIVFRVAKQRNIFVAAILIPTL